MTRRTTKTLDLVQKVVDSGIFSVLGFQLGSPRAPIVNVRLAPERSRAFFYGTPRHKHMTPCLGGLEEMRSSYWQAGGPSVLAQGINRKTATDVPQGTGDSSTNGLLINKASRPKRTCASVTPACSCPVSRSKQRACRCMAWVIVFSYRLASLHRERAAGC